MNVDLLNRKINGKLLWERKDKSEVIKALKETIHTAQRQIDELTYDDLT